MTAQLYDMADALDVNIEYTDLSHLERDGDYTRETNTIRLQKGMAHRLHRCVLAHELAHAVFGDVPSRFGPVNAKQERRADEWAALRLITPSAYQDAEHAHDGSPILIAQALDVITDIVHAYQRLLLRIGDTVYEAPRMGTGQWSNKKQVA